jgi:hypothetical protein
MSDDEIRCETEAAFEAATEWTQKDFLLDLVNEPSNRRDKNADGWDLVEFAI